MPRYLMNLVYRWVASICIVLLVPVFMLLAQILCLKVNLQHIFKLFRVQFLDDVSASLSHESLKCSCVPFCVVVALGSCLSNFFNVSATSASPISSATYSLLLLRQPNSVRFVCSFLSTILLLHSLFTAFPINRQLLFGDDQMFGQMLNMVHLYWLMKAIRLVFNCWFRTFKVILSCLI